MSSSEPTPVSDAEGALIERSFDTTMPSDYNAEGLTRDLRETRRDEPDSGLAGSTLDCLAAPDGAAGFSEVLDFSAVTRWLNPLPGPHLNSEGAAATRRLESLHAEVRQLLARHVAQARRFEPLVPSALSHEAWMRLSDPARAAWGHRSAFLAVAAALLRREVVTRTLALRAERPEADASVLISGLEQLAGTVDRDVVAVHHALAEFDAIDSRAARVVELRFFGGLENHEIAEAMGLSLATVKRDWATGRHWLQHELAEARCT